MAIYYGTKALGVIDERYVLKSKTADLVNNGMTLDYNGNGSVTIQTVEVVDEQDYMPTEEKRFGRLIELGNGIQTFTMDQDKCWQFSIDRKSQDDTNGAMDPKKAVARQTREVSIPNTDKFRIATAQAYAVATSQLTTHSGTAITTSNAYQYFLEASEYMINQSIEGENIVILMPPAIANMLKRDTSFKAACDMSYKDSKTGDIGRVDGMRVRQLPVTYFPANTAFLALSDSVLAAPSKTDMVRILTEDKDIDGVICQGRRRYACKIPTNRGKAIVLHMNA